MIDKKDIQITANKILEMIYSLYFKELKAGNITKDKLIPSFGKIIKKRKLVTDNGLTLFDK